MNPRNSELSRQFRVARQLIDMHSRLRDRFARRALLLDVVILAGSVVFSATTFASQDSFRELGLAPILTQNGLRVASVVLFFAAVFSLRVDWKGKAAKHTDAVRLLSDLLAAFRRAKDESGEWDVTLASDLDKSYWNVVESIVPVPTSQFTRLKAKYYRAIEVSKFIDAHPGCPHWLARWNVSYRWVKKGKPAMGEDGEPTGE